MGGGLLRLGPSSGIIRHHPSHSRMVGIEDSGAQTTRIHTASVPAAGLPREDVLAGIRLTYSGKLPEGSEDLKGRGLVGVWLLGRVHGWAPVAGLMMGGGWY